MSYNSKSAARLLATSITIKIMAEEERFDGIFMNIVQQAAGIENFFEALFGFMRRKTDYFSNPEAGKGMISKHFDAQLELFAAQKHREEETRKQKTAKVEPKPEPKAQPAPPAPKVMEITDEEAEAITSGKTSEESKEEPKAAEEESQPPPEGNGGRTAKYIWTQTLGEISVSVFIPQDTPSKQVRVNCTPTTLVVTAAGQEVVNGKLHKRVKPDELTWNIDSVDGRKVVAISVDKLEGMGWWTCIIDGDPEIDTKKIVPENSKLSDLDGEMRSTVEKMMVDQQRKAAGLPTTDEEQKQEMLKKFMKAHPEMDFSKAKFS